MTGNWTFQLEDGPHTIKAELSPWTGRLNVYFDNALAYKSQALLIMGEVSRFERAGHVFVLKVTGAAHFGQLTLTIDGRDVASQSAPPAQPQPSAVGPPSYQLLREVNVVDSIEIVDSGEYPLDNTNGNRELVMEQEISKTVRNDMSVQASGDIGGKIGVNLLSALTTELTAHLSRQVQQQIGETVTRRQTLKFNVDAGTAVVYVANWKRRVRTGEYLFLVDGQCVSVPYKVYYDLSCEIKSR